MKVRKSYLSVKIPTSIPERAEPETTDSAIPEPKNQQSVILTRKISLAQKISEKNQKIYVQGLAFNYQKSFIKVTKVSSISEIRESETPLRFRRYVESVLDISKNKSQRNYPKHLPSLSQNYEIFSKNKKNLVRNKLVPLSKFNKLHEI